MKREGQVTFDTRQSTVVKVQDRKFVLPRPESFPWRRIPVTDWAPICSSNSTATVSPPRLLMLPTFFLFEPHCNLTLLTWQPSTQLYLWSPVYEENRQKQNQSHVQNFQKVASNTNGYPDNGYFFENTSPKRISRRLRKQQCDE